MTVTIAPTTGTGVSRIDGPRKVTGAARYAADASVAQPLHAVLVQATISRGKISGIDASDASDLDGLVAVMTHLNAPRLEPTGFDFESATAYMEPGLMPLQSDDVHYAGQYVAVVIATTLETAKTAAGRLRVTYVPANATTAFNVSDDASLERVEQFFGSPLWIDVGDADAALAASDAVVDETYTTPEETHNALEPSATVAEWSDGRLTLHDATQWVVGTRNTVAHAFGIAPDAVHVVSPFVGGGFGSKGFVWPHTLVAAMAAKLVERPVKLVIDRPQFFTTSGHRSPVRQRIRLGAARDGKLTALVDDVISTTSRVGEFHEPCGKVAMMLYDVPNIRTTHHALRLDVSTPAPMRAPGEAGGTFAVESAIDELAYRLGIDPLELRIANSGDVDRSSGKPFSSKHLVECFREGAARFGWDRRSAAPRSMRAGDELIGYGVATATYPAMTANADVRVRVDTPGRVTVECATHDLGTGMYTIIAQVASDALGIPLDHVDVRIGDSSFPTAPVAGGSQSTAAVMPPLQAACVELRRLAGGDIANARPGLEAHATNDGETDEAYEYSSFGAQFCEVRYDEEIARLRVTRFTGVFDCGRILNPKTTRSQMIGGIVMGLGMALFEETVRDARSGNVVTNNLADYHVPSNADVPPIDIAFVDFPDYTFNSLGVRGVGEIGITGVAAAVANAVYHATGVRVRDLPILPDKLLASGALAAAR
jgi:xanthine dehydrogenase YagR molybdenum-binding subunit